MAQKGGTSIWTSDVHARGLGQITKQIKKRENQTKKKRKKKKGGRRRCGIPLTEKRLCLGKGNPKHDKNQLPARPASKGTKRQSLRGKTV